MRKRWLACQMQLIGEEKLIFIAAWQSPDSRCACDIPRTGDNFPFVLNCSRNYQKRNFSSSNCSDDKKITCGKFSMVANRLQPLLRLFPILRNKIEKLSRICRLNVFQLNLEENKINRKNSIKQEAIFDLFENEINTWEWHTSPSPSRLPKRASTMKFHAKKVTCRVHDLHLRGLRETYCNFCLKENHQQGRKLHFKWQ